MTRKALGRGINALFSGAPAAVEQGDVLQEVDVDLLEPNADQPRTIFREAKLDELAADKVWLSCTMILPLRVEGGGGSLVRPIAIGAPTLEDR